MKTLLISVLLMLFSSASLMEKPTDEVNLLDGTSLTYVYHDLGTVKVDMNNGMLAYEWLEGPFKGTVGKDHEYQARKISKKIYLVQWFESERTSLIALVINFKDKTVNSSGLLDPSTEKQTVLFHHANIIEQRLVER